MEHLVIFFLYGGGLVASAIFMLVATVLLQSRGCTIAAAILALIFTTMQGGCWHIASRATRSFDIEWQSYIYYSVWGIIVWAALLIVVNTILSARHQNPQELQHSESEDKNESA